MKTPNCLLLIALLCACVHTTRADDQAGWLKAAYESQAEGFFEALFNLPETSETVKSHIPGVKNWVGFEPASWARVTLQTKLEILDALGKQWDALTPEALSLRWRRVRWWSLISAELSSLSGSADEEVFFQVCFEDPALQPAFEWIIASRSKNFDTRFVGETLASGEVIGMRAHLVAQLMKTTEQERYACYSRLSSALTALDVQKAPGAVPVAQDAAELRRLLSLLSALHIGDDYAAAKKLVPALGVLQQDAGENNMEARLSTQFGKVAMLGEFNFSNGRLVSHGVATGELTHSQAHAFLLHCIGIMEELYGDSTRRVTLPEESDGPRDEIGISFNWHKNGALFGLDFHYSGAFAKVSWGAQAE